MVLCKLLDAAPSLTIPEKRNPRPASVVTVLHVGPAEASATVEPKVALLSTSGEEHERRAASWERKLQKFDTQDLGALQHREGLDRRVTTLRMRIEGMHRELAEVADEYATLQTNDDLHEAARWNEHEGLCVDAEAYGKPLPPPPRTIAGHYDASAALRGRDGYLKHRLHAQRGDRAPDWLPMLTAVLGTALTAWHELSRAPTSPASLADEQAPFRQAVAAIKAVGKAVQAEWRPEYNLCTHADGTAETAACNVIEGGVPFNFSDRYGEAWRVHLARLDECEDARAPLTGTRTNGELCFDSDAALPLDYSDQGRAHALADAAAGFLDPLDVEAAVSARGASYGEAIRTRWIRDRPNQPLSEHRLGEMVASRAKLELAKIRLAMQPDSGTAPAATASATFEDDLGH